MGTTNYTELTAAISKAVGQLRAAEPETMAGFNAMSKASMQAGALSEETKELIATAIAVAARCGGCIGFHCRTLVKMGVPREQLMEMLAVAVYMGGGPSLMYAAEAIQAYDEFAAPKA